MTGAKAPAGGIVSVVNGQFYNGGEFIPDTGEYCGRGRNKVGRDRFDRVARAVAAAGKRLEFRESTGEFVVLYPTGNIMVRAASLATIEKAFPATEPAAAPARCFAWDEYLAVRAEAGLPAH